MFEPVHRFAGLLSFLLVASCADDALDGASGVDAGAPPQMSDARLVRWVGVVEQTDVRVAAVIGNGKARLYFCGGAASLQSATRWFDLQFNGEHLEFRDDTWRIHAHLTAGGVLGELERAGDAVRTFNAQPFERATIAGLYEGRAACGRLGLIVTQPSKNDSPTAQGACVDDTDQPAQQLDPITPLALDDGKIMVRTPGSADGISLLQAATLDPR